MAMRPIPIYLNFDHSKPLGHVAMEFDYTQRCDYVLAIGGRGVAETKAGLPIDGEVLEFGLIPDSNYRAYLDDIKPLKWSRRPALPAVDPQENKQGLYPDEQAIMDKLMAAYEAFLKLNREHPDELREFVDGIHRCQDILGMRVLRRAVPTGWPTYRCEKDGEKC